MTDSMIAPSGRLRRTWRALFFGGVTLIVGVILSGCTAQSGASQSIPPSSSRPVESPPSSSTTEPATTSTTSTSTTSTSTSTTSTSTTVAGPTTSTIPGDGPSDTTLPHGSGVVATAFDGTAVAAPILATAQQVYDAALSHYFGAMRVLVRGDGTKRFRTGYTSGNPVDRWKDAIETGTDDPLARMIALLETTPGVTGDGQVVYPYLALKDPKTWDAADDAAAMSLGFSAESIAATKLKGRYLDQRLVFGADGQWRAFDIGAI